MSDTPTSATYAKDGGVNYHNLDPFKLHCQKEAARTAGAVNPLFGLGPLPEFVGESAAVFERLDGSGYVGTVGEGLGTLTCFADTLFERFGDPSGYHVCGWSNVGMIGNDLNAVGIVPQSMQMFIAVGDDAWLANEPRAEMLAKGFADASIECGAYWCGGETQTLRDITLPNTAVLAGNAIGFLPSPLQPYRQNVQAGDIILATSSLGMHANGISLPRRKLFPPDKITQEQLLQFLKPTRLYSKMVLAFAEKGLRPHYLIPITGHGLRKTMRAKANLTYRITKVLPVLPVFDLIQRAGNITDEEMWGTYNMGTGCIVIAAQDEAYRFIDAAHAAGYDMEPIGLVEEGPRRVIIEPVGITFESDSMQLS